MKALITLSAAALSAALAVPAFAENGDHPAVVVARLAKNASYDYASKFYLHPARLTLLAEAPREMGDHPAVIAARMAKNAPYDYASKFYLHPARLALSSEPPHEMGDHPAVMIARRAQEEAAEGRKPISGVATVHERDSGSRAN